MAIDLNVYPRQACPHQLPTSNGYSIQGVLIYVWCGRCTRLIDCRSDTDWDGRYFQRYGFSPLDEWRKQMQMMRKWQ